MQKKEEEISRFSTVAPKRRRRRRKRGKTRKMCFRGPKTRKFFLWGTSSSFFCGSGEIGGFFTLFFPIYRFFFRPRPCKKFNAFVGIVRLCSYKFKKSVFFLRINDFCTVFLNLEKSFPWKRVSNTQNGEGRGQDPHISLESLVMEVSISRTTTFSFPKKTEGKGNRNDQNQQIGREKTLFLSSSSFFLLVASVLRRRGMVVQQRGKWVHHSPILSLPKRERRGTHYAVRTFFSVGSVFKGKTKCVKLFSRLCFPY